jgi:hypothetical protein
MILQALLFYFIRFQKKQHKYKKNNCFLEMSFDQMCVYDESSHLHSPGVHVQFSHLHPSLPQPPWPR